MVDLANLEQREIALTFLRRTNQSRNRVAGAQIETPDLAGADIDIVRTGQVGAVGRAQKAEAILQYLEDSIPVDVFTQFRMRLQDLEDNVLLARARNILDAKRLTKFNKSSGRTGLEFRQVHHVLAGFELLGWNYLEIAIIVWVIVLRWPTAPATIWISLSFVARLVRAIFR